jgi:hypothetical protein
MLHTTKCHEMGTIVIMDNPLMSLNTVAVPRKSGEPISPEFRAALDKLYAEEARRFGPMLDAMLLEAQSLRLEEGHKARERTLRSLDTARMSRRRSQEAE